MLFGMIFWKPQGTRTGPLMGLFPWDGRHDRSGILFGPRLVPVWSSVLFLHYLGFICRAFLKHVFFVCLLCCVWFLFLVGDAWTLLVVGLLDSESASCLSS